MRSGKLTKLAAIIAVTASLAACVPHHGQKQVGGTLIGAGLGGLLGSTMGRGKGQLAAVAAGTLLGAFVGNQVGASLDSADRAYAHRAAQQSLEQAPSGQATGWKNPDSGNSGTYTPTRTYETAGGRYCREYQQTVNVGGQTQRAYGTACRQPDGSWKIRNAT